MSNALNNSIVVQVKLGVNESKGMAELYQEDVDFLIRLGLSMTWGRLDRGYVTAPASRAKGGRIGVARVLLDAKPGENIKYLDGNPLNLRRENLRLMAGGWSTRRDRDLLTPPELRRKRRNESKPASGEHHRV